MGMKVDKGQWRNVVGLEPTGHGNYSGWTLFNSIIGYKVKLIFSPGRQRLMVLCVTFHRFTSIHKSSLFKMVLY